MRLLTRTTLYFLVAMAVVLAAGGFIIFWQFSSEVNRQTDQELIVEEVQWIRYLHQQANLGSTFILRTPDITIYPTDGQPAEAPTFSQERGFSPRQQKEVPYRQLSHVVNVQGIAYQLVLRKSQEQKPVFVSNITRMLLLVFALLLVTMLFINRLINQSVWKPFRQSLNKIRGAQLKNMEAIRFEKSDISEFDELNTALNYMANRIYTDYVNVKEFTENAAHEMQTPLAVAQSKIELLLQDEHLADAQADKLAQAAMALHRLANLNQGLLLLARIDNQQYQASQPINLNQVANKYLSLFDEMITDKQLKVQIDAQAQFMVTMHPLLADSLVSNLLGNAIKYNHPGGQINLQLSPTQFCISNTSRAAAIPPQQVFRRFAGNHQPNQTSNGLGLAIVKKICDSHHLHIVYTWQNGLHQFCVQHQPVRP